MIEPDRRKAIYLLSQEGMAVREISRRLQVSRKAVRRVIRERGEVPSVSREAKVRIDSDLLRRLHEECGGYKQRIHERLLEEEKIEVAYSTLTRILRELGIGREIEARSDRVPEEPGAEMQHDTSPYTVEFGGQPTQVIASSLYLRYSKRRYLRFYRRFDRFRMKCFLHEALMHWGYALGDLAFLEALQWLSRHVPAVDPLDPAPPRPRSLLLPPRDDQKLLAVRRYLYGQRRLPPSLVEPLIASGSIYADTRANALFVLLGREAARVGAEIRGTTGMPWRGLAPGSRKDLGYFSVPVPEPAAIVLCESAIDALSSLALHPRALPISTAGARADPPWLSTLLESGKPIYCGFDADPTGDNVARAMIERHPTVRRLRPALKDWNDVLKAKP